jgi:hypothetical protein
MGFAVGGVTAGLLADAFNIPVAIMAVGLLTFFSGLIVAMVMYETLPSSLIPDPRSPFSTEANQ